jgi:hypothetical protein
MSQASAPRPQVQPHREPSKVAVGFTVCAAILLMLAGFFHAITGLNALAGEEVLVITRNYVFELSPTAWGWIHILTGALMVAATIGLFSAKVWARTIGVIVAMASLLASFGWLPYYPVSATIIIVIDVIVLWALTVHGSDILEV